MKFVKAHCGANDFIILDTRKIGAYCNTPLPNNFKVFVQQITKRRTGIGADGVIVIENSDATDFRVRYFNPDGSEYAVCANGSLCVLLYNGKEEATFSTGVGAIKGYLINNRARVTVVGPNEVLLSLTIDVEDEKLQLSFVEIGVPHAVVSVADVNAISIEKLAVPIRFHSYFGDRGANVNFMQIINKNKIATRSYERGVEGETFSCGSGSCACAIVGWLKGVLLSPIELKTKGGEFRIYINGLDEIWLEGTPKIVYEGKYNL